MKTKSQNSVSTLSTWEMVPHPAWKIAWSKMLEIDEKRLKIGRRGSVQAETLAK